MKLLKKVPLHPLFFSIFSVLSLYASNIKEVEPSVLIRPLVLSLAAGVVVYVLAFFLLRKWDRAALLASFILLLFFTYGTVYHYFEGTSGLAGMLGRHRYLIVVYGIIFTVGALLIVFRAKDARGLTAPLHAAGIFLVVFPLVQIGISVLQGQLNQQASTALTQEIATLTPADPEHLPDVYYIVLDGYTRSDALQVDFGYDNSYFVDGLQAQGFYVASCSRSNYGYTQGSITSTLNLDYLNALSERLTRVTPPTEDVFVLLKNSQVREQLQALGYQTVAFETGYEWSRLADADIYLSMAKDPYAMQQALKPFEALYIKNTALLLLTDSLYSNRASEFRNPNYPFADHVERERFILDQLPQLSGYSDQPLFVFAHVLVPHVPFVFAADGEVVDDPGFYSGDKAGPVNDVYRSQGYINQVEFISKAMLEITAEILANSSEPPVIVIMGDHGLIGENRLLILNAYYFPDQDYSNLYPGITPVNSFRAVFNHSFGQQLEYLPDISFDQSDGESVIVEDPFPECTIP